MNNFNKLYNLILQSIIVEDINSKIKKAIDTLIKSGQLTSEDDPKAQLVKTIIKRNANIDINGKTKLDELLKANQKYTNRAKATTNNYLDSIKEFTKIKEYDNGVVIYQVEDSSKGMRAVRKVIDAQWGEDANPWCLAARTGKNNDLKTASRYWKKYNAYPKHIAFQNGKLLAFNANSGDTYSNEPPPSKWWDRNDKPHSRLPLLDGTQMKTDLFTQKDIFERYGNSLKLNEETGRYDYSAIRMRVSDAYLDDGHFPVPFGVIGGDFDCNDCDLLQTLENAPTEVKGNFNCGFCRSLKSLKGMPQKIGGGIFIASNYALENLEGMPEVCHGPFQAYGMKSLKSLKGCSQVIEDNCYITSDVLQSLQGGPQEVKGNLNINGNIKLKNLKGIAQKISGGINLYKCESLQSLEGISPDFIGEIVINECPNLKVTQEEKKKYKFVSELSYYG